MLVVMSADIALCGLFIDVTTRCNHSPLQSRDVNFESYSEGSWLADQ
ncbi:hypothetical protein GP2143_12641 [marine gamma proteobacterium HTCC2143]|uniref:Uncharacterized protein n=1 Tax=marine gamma proteobacterium HTCC2143 TaxID=247633 RepID=A0Y7J8_9GAMM|nr:hypothetical protein GP2143_12641 [marine gamma proteobacterium HTCC2143]